VTALFYARLAVLVVFGLAVAVLAWAALGERRRKG
jgi:hypothetical protein